MINEFGAFQRSALLATAAAIIVGGIGSSAQAQQVAPATDRAAAPGRSAELDEIIVTASKRAQKLSDVGVSVTAVSGDELAARGITDTVGITETVPNLVNASVFGPGSNTNFSIRGVSQNDFNDGTESPVATYVDDVYLVPTGAGSFPLYDMERVEVLRGPQGTLFGRNSTGGLINFISAKPNDAFLASGSASYGSYNERTFTGIVNAPLGDIADLRVSGRYQNNDGWIKNVTGDQPKSGQIETESIRGQLLLKPSSTFKSLFKTSYDKASGFSSGVLRQPVGIDATTGDQFLLRPDQDFYGTGPGKDKFGVGSAGGPNEADNGQLRKLKGATSLTIENTTNWKISHEITLTSVTAFNHYKRNQTEDCDGTQARICATHYQNGSKQFSQELRAFGDMGSLRWTVGAYYLNQKATQSVIAPLYLDVQPLAVGVDAHLKAKGYAAFANVEYDILPKLTVVGGYRWARDVKSIQQRNGIYLANNTANPFLGYENDINPYSLFGTTLAENVYTDATANGANHLARNGWSGKIELDYKPQSGTLLYGSVSRGLKSAGFNNGIISIGLPASKLVFEPETLLAYETGFKSSFLDRKASVAISAFYYDYSKYQSLNFIGIGSFITNRDARIYGSEVEFNFKPVPELTLQINGGAINTKLYSSSNADGFTADRKMPLAPSWTLSASARYDLTVGNQNTLAFQLDGSARDSFYNNPGNDSAAKVPVFTNVNARIDFIDAHDRYKFGVAVRNLLNTRYITSIFLLQGLGGYRYAFYNPPRQINAELTVNFR